MKGKRMIAILLLLLLFVAACGAAWQDQPSTGPVPLTRQAPTAVPNNPSPLTAIDIFWVIGGLGLLGIGFLAERFNKRIGVPGQDELFTVPKFRQTAQLNGRISRFVMIFLGLGMIINSVGDRILPPPLATVIANTLLTLAILGILLMIGITIRNWRI